MEVRHQRVDDTPLIRPADEQAGAPGRLAGGCPGLQAPHDGRAHGHHPPGPVQSLLDAGRHLVLLGVHVMVVETVGGDGPERVESDRQLDRHHLGARIAHPAQELPGEVQACGRGRG